MEDSLAEFSEITATVAELVSAFAVFMLCGAENTIKIAVNSMYHLSRLRACELIPARNIGDFRCSLRASHWATGHISAGTLLWLVRFSRGGTVVPLYFLSISNA